MRFYDADNRLKQTTISGSTVNFTCDFAHRPAKCASAGSSVRYIYDQKWNVLTQIDGTSGATQVYHWLKPPGSKSAARYFAAGGWFNTALLVLAAIVIT